MGHGSMVSVTVGDKQFQLTPLVLSQRGRLVEAIASEIEQVLKEHPGALEKAKHAGASMAAGDMTALKPFLQLFGERVKSVYAVVLNEDPDWIAGNLTMAQELLLVDAFIEVNDLPLLADSWRRLAGRFGAGRNTTVRS